MKLTKLELKRLYEVSIEQIETLYKETEDKNDQDFLFWLDKLNEISVRN